MLELGLAQKFHDFFGDFGLHNRFNSDPGRARKNILHELVLATAAAIHAGVTFGPEFGELLHQHFLEPVVSDDWRMGRPGNTIQDQ